MIMVSNIYLFNRIHLFGNLFHYLIMSFNALVSTYRPFRPLIFFIFNDARLGEILEL